MTHKVHTQRGISNAFAVAFALLMLTGINGCRSLRPIPPPPTPQEIDKVLPSEACPQPSACAEDPDGPFYPSLDIYIDDSGSMRGFVARPQANYLTVLQHTLEAAAAAQFNLKVYPLSSSAPVPPTPMSRFAAASFYEKPDTPLAALVTRIAAQAQHTAIIISDLVQSERQQNKDIQALITVLRQLVEKRSEIRLFAFRSDFLGDYYPESHSKAGLKFLVDVSQSVPGAGRPFYLLVLAPNSTTMEKVSEYIVNRLYPTNSFDPTHPAFEISGMELTRGGSEKPNWMRYSKFVMRNAEKRVFDSTYVIVAADTQNAMIDLPITVEMSEYAPVRRLEAIEIKGRVATWSLQATGPTIATVPVSGQWSIDSKTVQLKLKLRRPAPLTWDVYRLYLRPGPGNLAVPEWVGEWSTEDDSSLTEGNKTYQLGLLVQTMENAISERQLCGEWTLKVNGGT